MENSLFIGQFWNFVVEINQKVFQIVIVRHEESKVLIRLFESNRSDDFQILYVSVERLKQCSFIGVQNVVSLFTSDDLTDWVRPDQKLDDFNRFLWNKFHEILTKLNNVFLLLFQRHSDSNVLQCFFIVLLVLNQNFQVKFMLAFLLCQFHGLFIMGQILANFNCGFNIEKVAFKRRFWKEITEIFNFLLLYIAIQQQGSMLLFSYFSLMDFFQILNQEIDLRNIQILSDYIRRFNKTNCQNILLDGVGKLAFGVQRITMKSWNFGQEAFFTILIFGESISFIVKGPFEESFNLERIVPFNQLQNHSLIFLIANHQQNCIVTDQDILYFRKLFTVSNVNVQSVVNVHSVLIWAFFSVVLSLLETYHN